MPLRIPLILVGLLVVSANCAKLKNSGELAIGNSSGPAWRIDDGTMKGLVGNVFAVDDMVTRNDYLLANADLDHRIPLGRAILAPMLDIPARTFTDGFPGVTDRFEWFALRLEGKLVITKPGDYTFRLTSDDGSLFYLNGALLASNDGVHAPTAVEQSIGLEVGSYPMKLDYYQGPREQIALQLEFKEPGASSFRPVPPENFDRP